MAIPSCNQGIRHPLDPKTSAIRASATRLAARQRATCAGTNGRSAHDRIHGHSIDTGRHLRSERYKDTSETYIVQEYRSRWLRNLKSELQRGAGHFFSGWACGGQRLEKRLDGMEGLLVMRLEGVRRKQDEDTEYRERQCAWTAGLSVGECSCVRSYTRSRSGSFAISRVEGGFVYREIGGHWK